MADLTARSVASLAETLGALSANWLKRGYFFRRKAIKNLVSRSGFDEKTAEALLDAFFSELTKQKLLRLLRSEIRDPAFLDGFQRDPLSGNFVKASGPRMILHVFSANAPNPAILSFIFGMLVKSRNVGKLSSRDEGFLKIYLESLRAIDPQLAATNRLIHSDRVGAIHELPLLAKKADLIVAYGTDETLTEIARILPPGKPFVGYGHRVSFSFYTKDALNKKAVAALAIKTARDIWMLDQRGCLSPLVIYVEKDGEISPQAFASQLALSLNALAETHSRAVFKHRSAAHAAWKNLDKVRRTAGKMTGFWQSDPPGRWAVLYDEETGGFPFSEGGCSVRVRGFANPETVFRALTPIRKHLQAVGLEVGAYGNTPLRIKTAKRFSEMGVNRICRAGRLQAPPLLWHHDGRFNLASWIRWTDLEV